MDVTHQTGNTTALAVDSSSPSDDEARARALAVKHIESKRAFVKHVVSYVVVMTLLVVIWAISEYNNAGGWPTDGLSQSSSIPHVWNVWIIYPVLGWGALLAAHGWFTYKSPPISEGEIRREIKRLR